MKSSLRNLVQRVFINFLRHTAGLYFRFRYRLRAENLEALKEVPGPWLILPNHVMTWDPVLIGLFINRPVHFVSSDANFRGAFASRWLRRLGTIPTSKQATDFSTLRRIVQTLKEGGHVALFPEGERTWDGVSMPIISSTAKLVRLANTPVIVPVLKGAYQSRPRWTYTTRPGPVTVEYKVAIRREELESMSLADIENRIRECIYHDDHEYQRKQKAAYRCSTPAEPLQAVLFACPQCRNLNTMQSRGDRFFCTSCGWESRFTTSGHFESIEGHAHYHDNIRQWSLWQLEELETRVAERIKSGDSSPLFSDHPAVYSTGYKFEILKEHTRGTISLNIHGISFAPGQRQ